MPEKIKKTQRKPAWHPGDGYIDIRPGVVIGKITVVAEASRTNDKYHRRQWHVRCECGTEKVVLHQHLCGPRRMIVTCGKGCRAMDLTGQTFGKFSVIERVPGYTQGCIRFKVRCECGKVSRVSSFHLQDGHRQSCGCSKPALCREMQTRRWDRQLGTARSRQTIWRRKKLALAAPQTA